MKATGYILQAALILLWWIGLHYSPQFFAAFQFEGVGATAFRAFLLPDLLVIAALSLYRAYRYVAELEYVILGGFSYAFLYCLNATLLTGSGLLPTTVMGLGLAYNGFLLFGERAFRQSTSTFTVNVLKTLLQIVCVWSITLVVFPYLLLMAAGGVDLPAPGPQRTLGGLLFLLSSLLGLASALYMVRQGEGTPLPLDQSRKLVIAGPYRHVRNPMAVAGIGQGVALSVLFGSWALLAYALLGAGLWHWVVRPLEERNLLARFGAEYRTYRERVRCWWPVRRRGPKING